MFGLNKGIGNIDKPVLRPKADLSNTTVLQGGIEKTGMPTNIGANNTGSFGLWDSLKNGIKTALFMEAMRNLNWSRSYLWYVELDGVPNPFQRGGVLGLPCKSITFELGNGESYNWSASTIGLAVPKGASKLGNINLEVMDDEQGTLRQFFERWYNMIYNPYKGVLPVIEACKQLSIYYQKSTRRNIKRIYYDIDRGFGQLSGSLTSAIDNSIKQVSDSTFALGASKGKRKIDESLDFLVYPQDNLMLSLNTNQSDVISFNVNLQVVYFVNQDFGNPTVNSGAPSVFGELLNGDEPTTGSSWMDRIADYI